VEPGRERGGKAIPRVGDAVVVVVVINPQPVPIVIRQPYVHGEIEQAGLQQLQIVKRGIGENHRLPAQICNAQFDVVRGEVCGDVLQTFVRDPRIEGVPERAAIRSAGLTLDQVRLMQLLSEGYSNKAIALLEQAAENTIKMRVRVLLAKLDVTNRTQAAVMAARAGMRLDQPETLAEPHPASPEYA
jgi:DNA-binding CsgD family transcriptional regulator